MTPTKPVTKWCARASDGTLWTWTMAEMQRDVLQRSGGHVCAIAALEASAPQVRPDHRARRDQGDWVMSEAVSRMPRWVWRAWGNLFWRHFDAGRSRLSRREWYRDFVHRLWNVRDALINHPVRWRLYRLLREGNGTECPHCGYPDWTEYDDLFVCEASGGPDANNAYWWHGQQTCARCGVTNEYADGS